MKLKNITTVIFVLLLLLIVSACGQKQISISQAPDLDQETSVDSETEGIAENNIETVDNETEEIMKSDVETKEEQKQLSSDCDVVLLKATDENGDVYELVGTQKETYNSVEIKLGVIRNNEWLVNLTSDLPFFNEEGLLFTGVTRMSYIDDYSDLYDDDGYYREFKYLGNGCFLLTKKETEYPSYDDDKGILYNCITGKGINLYTHPELTQTNDGSILHGTIYLSNDCKPYNNKYLISHQKNNFSNKTDFYLLDRNTLELEKIANDIPTYSAFPYSDGLFAVESPRSQASFDFSSDYYFYNSSGVKVLDLSSFNIQELDSNHGFVNGKCSFYVKNKAGTRFKITIDKSGNAIEQTEVNSFR